MYKFPSVRSYYECSLEPPSMNQPTKDNFRNTYILPLKVSGLTQRRGSGTFYYPRSTPDPFSLYAQGFQFCRRLFEIPEADSLDSQFPRRFTVFRRIVDKDAFLRIQAVSVQKDFIDCRL